MEMKCRPLHTNLSDELNSLYVGTFLLSIAELNMNVARAQGPTSPSSTQLYTPGKSIILPGNGGRLAAKHITKCCPNLSSSPSSTHRNCSIDLYSTELAVT
jgi:hypothetical protein